MKAFIYASFLLIFVLGWAQAQGHHKKTHATTKANPVREGLWWSNAFCPDTKICDTSALWYGPEHGTILLLWKDDNLSISIFDHGQEHKIGFAGTKRTDSFRKESSVACTDCGKLKNGDPVMLATWQTLDSITGTNLLTRPWVQHALGLLPKTDERVKSLLVNQEGAK
jgi:hypothetical protein